jgi:hypothetical protein
MLFIVTCNPSGNGTYKWLFTLKAAQQKQHNNIFLTSNKASNHHIFQDSPKHSEELFS